MSGNPPLANRRCLAMRVSQIVTQVGGNALLCGLTVDITARTASTTAMGAMLWVELLPSVLVSIPAGMVLDQADAGRLSREAPEAARRRIFGSLNMLVALAAVAPTLVIAPLADWARVDRVLLLIAALLGAILLLSTYSHRGEIWVRAAARTPEADTVHVGLGSGGWSPGVSPRPGGEGH